MPQAVGNNSRRARPTSKDSSKTPKKQVKAGKAKQTKSVQYAKGSDDDQGVDSDADQVTGRDSSTDSDVDAGSDVDSTDSKKADARDGFADMLSKILNQSVDSKTPVLAKRKTAIMREIATTQASQAANRIERKERLEKKRRQLVIPDVSTANFERQLKKLATRGVVSLFNAVAKTKRDLEEAGELSSSGTSSKAKGKSKSDAAADRELGALRLAGGPGGIDKTTLSQEVRKLSKENFLGLLSKSEKQSSMAVGIGNNSNSNSNNNSTSNSLSNSNSSGAGSKWAALQDDYLTKGGLTLKNWDKDEEPSSDEDKKPAAGSKSKKQKRTV